MSEWRNVWYNRNEKDDHQLCLECGEKMVCHIKKICGPCDLPLHYITDKVAVGSCGASYNDFTLIFNLNYPENNTSRGEINKMVGTQPNRLFDQQQHTYYAIGMKDRDTPEDLETLRKAIHLLPDVSKKGDEVILFHCFAGYSRSVALATAYIALHYNKTVDEALAMIIDKRKYVGPNPAFIALIRTELDALRRG